jgi:hypothetical protein
MVGAFRRLCGSDSKTRTTIIMSRTLTQVLVERERLRAQAAQQRAAMAAAWHGLAGPAALIDRVAAGGRYLRRHPLALAALAGAAILLRGRPLMGAVARGVGLWRMARRIRTVMHLFGR